MLKTSSIEARFFKVFLLFSLVFLLASFIIVFLFFRSRELTELTYKTEAIARITAENILEPLKQQDIKNIEKKLSMLKNLDFLSSVSVITPQNRLLSVYPKSATSVSSIPSPEAGITTRLSPDNRLLVFVPLYDKDILQGTLVMEADASFIISQALKFALFVSSCLLIVVIACWAFSWSMLSYMLMPVRRLSSAASKIARQIDFNTRIPPEFSGELKRISDALNTMLDYLKQRDSALIEAKIQAEESANRAGILAKEARKVNQQLIEAIKKSNEVHKALRQSEKKYREIFENAQEGIYRADDKNRFIDANPAMARILGYQTPRELISCIGDIRAELFCDPEEQKKFYSRLLKNGWVERFICRLKKKSGSETWVSLQARVFRKPGGEVSYIQGYVVDVSELIRAQATLKASYEVLEQKIRERTAELRKTNEQLRKAKEKADAAARAKSEFLANMTHEIRTPLNGVIGIAELAASEPLSPKLAHYMKTIHRSGTALLRILDRIIDYSRLEDRELPLEKSFFSPSEIFENLAIIYGPYAVKKEIELIFDIADDIPASLYGDPLRFQQALGNILDNAIKFTNQGNIILNVRYRAANAGKIRLLCKVKDTGPGITKDVMKKLFIPFELGDASMSRKHSGTGLGLCISKQIAQLMNGDIFVESTPGKGSTFTLDVQFDLPAQTEKREIRQYNSALGNKHAIIVEDNPEARRLLAGILESFGISSISAGTESEALELIHNYTTMHKKEIKDCFIFIDTTLSGSDPVSLARTLKLEISGEPRVIILTPAGYEDRFATKDVSGIDIFIRKPFTPGIIYDALMELMKDICAEKYHEDTSPAQTRNKINKGIKGFTVLVADDSQTNLEITRSVLTAEGVNVLTARNGKEALEIMEKNHVDLVLMDIQMPEMDGIEATSLIRKNISPFVPVIALTASSLDNDKAKCLNAGMNEFLIKPIRNTELIEVVTRYLQRKKKNNTTQ